MENIKKYIKTSDTKELCESCGVNWDNLTKDKIELLNILIPKVIKKSSEQSWRDNSESLKCVFNALRPICSRDENDHVLKGRVSEVMTFCSSEIDWIQSEFKD